MWTLRQNLESSGHQEKYKSHTSVGRKFAPVEGLSHDLVCTGSIYHVHFAWQVWHGQLSPRFKFNKLKSFSGVEIDQNHVDNKMILGGKGFAVGRLKRHNFCPASALRNRRCIDTKRCSGPHLPRKMDMINRSGTDQVMTQTFNRRKLSSYGSVTFVFFLVPRALQILPQSPHKRELFSCPPWSLLVSTQTQHLWLSISTWAALSVNATPVP